MNEVITTIGAQNKQENSETALRNDILVFRTMNIPMISRNINVDDICIKTPILSSFRGKWKKLLPFKSLRKE